MRIRQETPRPRRHGRRSQALELELRRLGFAQVGDHRAGAARPRAGREIAGAGLELASPSLSISATSIPSIDVPLMTPIAVSVLGYHSSSSV
jgi:hypothetical protein